MKREYNDFLNLLFLVAKKSFKEAGKDIEVFIDALAKKRLY